MSYNHPTQDDDPVEGQATCGSEPAPGQAPSSDECSGFPHHNGEWDYEVGDPSLASAGVATADQPDPPPAGQDEQSSPRAPDGAKAPKSRTSLAQWAANRRNAQHSTGPRSEKGKRASSFNAMTHGIYAQANPIPNGTLAEDPEEVQVFVDSVVKELAPRDAQELVLARRIANSELSLARLDRFESVGLGSAGRLSRSHLEQGIGGEAEFQLMIENLDLVTEHLGAVNEGAEDTLVSPAWDRVANLLQDYKGIRRECLDVDEGLAEEEYQTAYRNFVLQVLVPRHWKDLKAAVTDLTKRFRHVRLQAWEREGQAEEIAVRNAVETGGILDRTSTLRARFQRTVQRDREDTPG